MMVKDEERPTWSSTAKILAFVAGTLVVGFVLAHFMFAAGFRLD